MPMLYADKTMRVDGERYEVPSRWFFLRMAAMGGVIGVALALFDAPLWTFYVAPVLMAPPLLRELHALDAREAAKRDS